MTSLREAMRQQPAATNDWRVGACAKHFDLLKKPPQRGHKVKNQTRSIS
jgi:hypothetical protein